MTPYYRRGGNPKLLPIWEIRHENVDPAWRGRIDSTRVAAMLGLTASEGRVAALLAEAKPVRQIAAVTGFRETYVRWLIQQVYKKLGVSDQVALARQVLAVDALPRR